MIIGPRRRCRRFSVICVGRRIRRVLCSKFTRTMLKLAAMVGVAAILYMVVPDISALYILGIVFLLYAVTGGYDYLLIIYRTGVRDVRAGFRYLKLLLKMRECQKNNLTVPKMFQKNVQKHPNKICFYFEDQQWTFAQVDEYSNRVANFFLSEGFQSGDSLALFMENRPEFVCIWLGLAKVGIIPALINFNLRQKPLVHCVKVAQCKGIIFSLELMSAIRDISGSLEVNSHMYCAIAGAQSSFLENGMKNLDELLKKASPVPPPGGDKVNYTDKLLYIYTSGTTGLPKAAIIRHSRFLFFCLGVYYGSGVRHSDIIYDPLPLYHTAGGMIGSGQAVLYGCSTVVRKRFSASSYWSDVVRYSCTVAQYIGEICRYLLTVPPKPEDKNHRVRLMFGNGLRPQIWEQFTERFNIPRVCEFYGATEGNANIINMDGKVGAVGFVSRIVPSVYPCSLIKVNSETGEPLRDKNGLCILCEPGEPGEFIGKIVRNHPVRDFHGYADKSATKKKIVENVFTKGDSAFLSGDILVMDRDGYLYFKDRTGDTFRWRGENVSTSEVEGVISNITEHKDVVVYGVEVPNIEGRAGMAAILDPENQLDLNKLAVGLVNSLPSYARPLFIRIVKEIDTTGTYKLKKIDLRKSGFDVNSISDPLYLLDVKQNQYLPLTKEVFEKIQNGVFRL